MNNAIVKPNTGFKFLAIFLIAVVCQTTQAVAPEVQKSQVFVDSAEVQGIIVRYRDTSLQQKSAIDRTSDINKRIGARISY